MSEFKVPGNTAAWAAVKALARGDASPEQQRRALKYIVEALARTYHPSFAATERETAYLEGRRYVGLAIVEIVNTVRKRKDGEPREQPG